MWLTVHQTQIGGMPVKYSLVDQPSTLPGICNADSVWLHIDCGQMLHSGGEHSPSARTSVPHICARCGKVGFLGQPTAPEVAGQTSAVEWMLARWIEDGDLRRDLSIPSSPTRWQGFLAEYFPSGAWVMPVLDQPGYPSKPDQPARLCVRLIVERADERTADLALPMPDYGPTIFLTNTCSIEEHDIGVLVLKRADGKAVRLDAHLTAEDRELVRWSISGGPYSGVRPGDQPQST